MGHRRPAQALVELALVLVVLCSLAVAAFDFGRVVNLYLVTVHATREAARVASIAGTSTSAVQSAGQDAAKDAIAPAALSVTCQSATFNAASGTYSTGGTCVSPLVADTAFVVTVSTTVTPVVPFSGLLFGSLAVGPIPVTYSVAGIVQASQ